MKRIFSNLQKIILAWVLTGTLYIANASVFSDDFESGLGQWVGKEGGPHSGVTAADPLAAGHGSVLNFTSLIAAGDMFTATPISASGPLLISFDYLGIPGLGGVPGDLGGFLGVAFNLNPTVINGDHIWLSGTKDTFPGVTTPLIDDGTWHHYDIVLDGTALGVFRLIVEDFFDSGGVAGDAFFDNIVISSVPEPTTSTLLIAGFVFILVVKKRFGSHT
jgi:hypothetical protein